MPLNTPTLQSIAAGQESQESQMMCTECTYHMHTENKLNSKDYDGAFTSESLLLIWHFYRIWKKLMENKYKYNMQ